MNIARGNPTELFRENERIGALRRKLKERELSASSVNIAVNAVRFLYGVTLDLCPSIQL
jgi:hypothetical protein